MRVTLIPLVFATLLAGCVKPETKSIGPDTSQAEEMVEKAFGSLLRNHDGRIVGVDLARERTSATDDVLKAALSIPDLKTLRVAGSAISSDAFRELSKQNQLEELFLQDLPIRDDDLVAVGPSSEKLKRITFRRLTNVSDRGIVSLLHLPVLEHLGLIEMNLTASGLESIFVSKTITSLDLRHCAALGSGDYRLLDSLKELTDLKIGGFAIDDETLKSIASLPALRGLTIDDSSVTPDGFGAFLSSTASASTLETLVLNRNSAIFDDGLLSLQKLTKLRRFSVCGMMITGEFLGKLAENEASRPKLSRLSLRKSFLNAETALYLKRYPELRILDLSGVAMTPESASVVASLSSLEELDLADCQLDEETSKIFESMKSLKKFKR